MILCKYQPYVKIHWKKKNSFFTTSAQCEFELSQAARARETDVQKQREISEVMFISPLFISAFYENNILVILIDD